MSKHSSCRFGEHRWHQFLLVVLVGLVGCSQRSSQPTTVSDAEVIGRTRESLNDLLRLQRIKLESHETDDECQAEQFGRALELLENASVSDFEHPTPVAATIARGKHDNVLLLITYLGRKPNIARICVEDAQGHERAAGGVTFSYFIGGLVQLASTSIVAPGFSTGDYTSATMKLDPECFDKKLSVSVIDDEGVTSDPVRVQVDPVVQGLLAKGEESGVR